MAEKLEKGQFRISYVKSKGEWVYNDKKRLTGPKKSDLVVGEIFTHCKIGGTVKRLAWSEASDGMYIQFEGMYQNIFFLEFSSQYTCIFGDGTKLPLTCKPSEMGITPELDLEISHTILKNNKKMDLPKSSFDEHGVRKSDDEEEEETIEEPTPSPEVKEKEEVNLLPVNTGRITKVFDSFSNTWRAVVDYDPHSRVLKCQYNTLAIGNLYNDGRFGFSIQAMAWDWTGWILFIKSSCGNIYAFEFPPFYDFTVKEEDIIPAEELHSELTREKQDEIRLNLAAIRHDRNLLLSSYNNSYKGKDDLKAVLKNREETEMKEKAKEKLDLLDTSAENLMFITPNMVTAANYTTSSTTTITSTVISKPSNPIVRVEAIMQRQKGDVREGDIWEGTISGEQFKDNVPFQVVETKNSHPVTFYVKTVIDHKPGVYCIFEESYTVYRLDYV